MQLNAPQKSKAPQYWPFVGRKPRCLHKGPVRRKAYLCHGGVIVGKDGLVDVYLDKLGWYLNQSIWASAKFADMMTSSNGNIYALLDPLWGESTGDRWIHLTKASDAELWCFLWFAHEQTVEQAIETPVIWRCHRAHYDVTVMDPHMLWLSTNHWLRLTIIGWSNDIQCNSFF